MGEKAGMQARTSGLGERSSSFRAHKTVAHQSGPPPSDCVLRLHGTIGNQAVQRLFRSGFLQAKLRIGQPNDLYEQEADRVANQAMRIPDNAAISCQHSAVSKASGSVQAKTGCLFAEGRSSLTALRGGGKPLTDSERAFFEPRFGADFSNVRVHSGSKAGELAHMLQARAFTVGRDIFSGRGEYSPGTVEGGRLLAHELTHVVQQERSQLSGPVAHGAVPERLRLTGAAPGIQRKLLVTGKPKDVKALFNLLEPASGFTLKHDTKTHEVSIIASRLKPSSFVLAARLAEIIDDPNQDAELNLGLNQPGVGFGKFPFDPSAPLVQEIDVADIEAVEAGAPGSGVALLIHEIVENYQAHKPSRRDITRTVVFAASHKEALEAEALVAGELVGAGERVADISARAPSGDIREVLDYENYYLFFDHRGGKVVNARKVGRVKVSDHDINGFKAGSNELPTSALSTIEAAVTDLEANPFATVRIEGGHPEQDPSKTRMAAVRDAILITGKGRKGFDVRSKSNFHLVGNDAANFKQRVVITVERPDMR